MFATEANNDTFCIENYFTIIAVLLRFEAIIVFFNDGWTLIGFYTVEIAEFLR